MISNGEDLEFLPGIMHLEDVIATNGLGLEVDSDSLGWLFLNASRINHSCLPNAEHTCHEGSSHKVVFANRNIVAGEEIRISYIANNVPFELRQLFLKQWGFSCDCPACVSSHPEFRPFEQRIKELQQLHQDPCMDIASRLRDGEKWSPTTLEHAAARAQRRIELLTGHHALGRFSRQA
jgi:hypothetical protein